MGSLRFFLSFLLAKSARRMYKNFTTLPPSANILFIKEETIHVNKNIRESLQIPKLPNFLHCPFFRVLVKKNKKNGENSCVQTSEVLQ
mmetsp:Transcript_34753/g.80340  ORF Transcript_34753/g.80340 Transcript_34753/m.80340 type:complete len:88 (-) Transcript_34753:526-789(-)